MGLRLGLGAALFAVNVELEVFVVDLFVGAIATNGLDGGVQLALERILALAQTNAGADTKVFGDKPIKS